MKRLIKRLFNKNRHFIKEWAKLKTLPRYQYSSTKILSKELYFVDACTLLAGYEEIFLEEIYKFKTKNLTPVIIDCGSNIGLSILYFKKLFPESTITGFEADPKIFSVLKSNIASFNLTNVTVFNKAVWIDNNSITFSSEGGYSGRIAQHAENNLINIETIRLKNLLNTHVDFLKLDIEGAENDVIFDCAENLKNVDKIFLEYHSHINDVQKLGDILNLFKEHNFRYQITNAYASEHPFFEINTMVGMDLQLNIFAYK